MFKVNSKDTRTKRLAMIAVRNDNYSTYQLNLNWALRESNFALHAFIFSKTNYPVLIAVKFIVATFFFHNGCLVDVILRVKIERF